MLQLLGVSRWGHCSILVTCLWSKLCLNMFLCADVLVYSLLPRSLQSLLLSGLLWLFCSILLHTVYCTSYSSILLSSMFSVVLLNCIHVCSAIVSDIAIKTPPLLSVFSLLRFRRAGGTFFVYFSRCFFNVFYVRSMVFVCVDLIFQNT